MSRTLPFVVLAIVLAGCAHRVDLAEVPVGTEVEVFRRDGGVVRGTLVALNDLSVKIKGKSASRVVALEDIAEVQLVGDDPRALPAVARFREFAMPEGTRLAVRLESPVGSESSRVGDQVEATLTHALIIDGTEVLPAGSVVGGEVTAVQAAGKVKGRASLSLRFGSVARQDERYAIAARVALRAPATKGEDAAKIAIPAAGGAILGALFGGKQGAAIGSAIGGGAGTAVVLSTAGREVRLPRGAALSLRLDHTVDVRVPIDKS
jgi:hypothetical protein